MKQVLVLNVPPELEEGMVDYLLNHEQKGFTSYPVRGHGEHKNLSIAEQVTGRRKRVQFELIVEENLVQVLLGGLGNEVGRDVFWWLQPVLASGHV